MKVRLIFLLFLLCAAKVEAQRNGRRDTILMVRLDNQDINSTRKWPNDTVWYHYNQMKYYVKTVLPYVLEAETLFNEMNARLNDPALTGKQRRQYIREKEGMVHERFEDKILTLNETQGVLLIKLIARQTGFNIYQQLGDIKGSLSALKWQGWALVHGFNLNRKYHPEDEVDLEHIMRSLGYQLPAFYNNGDVN